MPDTFVISGLLKKRGEIAGKIEAAQGQLQMLISDLDSLDVTIRIFKPDIDLAEVKPKPLPPRHHAFKGEVTRIAMDTLRNAQRPVSAQEIAVNIIAARGLNAADKPILKLITKRVGSCLRHWRQKGMVQNAEGSGPLKLWEIAR